MPPDSTATKARILDAAFAEFAQYGLAGARVDRIAEVALANKRSIYVHFGNKEELFDLVLARGLAGLQETVPFTPEDLPGYAVALFDHSLKNPELMRLSGWAHMERQASTDAETASYRAKFDALAGLRSRSKPESPVETVDTLAMTLALVGAWFSASAALRDMGSESAWSAERLDKHKAALRAAVAAVSAL